MILKPARWHHENLEQDSRSRWAVYLQPETSHDANPGDRELGILTTEWFHFAHTVSQNDTNYADCGTLDLFSHGVDRRGRLRLLVREDSSGVALRINAEYEQSYSDQPGTEAIVRSCVSTGYVEGRIRILVAEALSARGD